LELFPFLQEFAKEYQVLSVEKQQNTSEAGIKNLLYETFHSLTEVLFSLKQ